MSRSLARFIEETLSGLPAQVYLADGTEQRLRVGRLELQMPLELSLRRAGGSPCRIDAQPVRGRLETGFRVPLGSLSLVAEGRSS